MSEDKLTLFQERELKYLRQQVDRLQDEEYRRDARPDVKRNLWTARKDLDAFVRDLREVGKLI